MKKKSAAFKYEDPKRPIKPIEPTPRGPVPPEESLRIEINDFKGLDDDQLYAIAWKEVENKRPHEGLWAKMFVENDGDEDKTKVAYLKLRVEELQIQRENEIEAETKRLEVVELERIKREEDEKRRRQAYVTANEAREKREAEEEEKLLIRLRNSQPLSEWERDDYIGNLVLLKNAVKEINGDQVLRLIRSGANPTAILTDKNTDVQKGLSSNSYLRNIIAVSDRLWKKGILTVDGLVEK